MKAMTLTRLANLFATIPLLLGLATMAAAPTAQAVTVNEVDIIDGEIDVNEDGFIFTDDDLINVILWCNPAAPVRVDIIDGKVDVTELNGVNSNDDLLNCALNDENTINGEQTPTRNQVDIKDGFVDVDEDSVIGEAADDAPNVQLFVLP